VGRLFPRLCLVYDACMSLKTITRAVAWLLLGAITFATVSPLGLRPRLDVPISLERAAAFGLLGLAFAAAYPKRIWSALGLVLFAAIGLELLQNVRPDRHGRELDAVVKIGGASVGLAVGWLIVKIADRKRRT